MHLRLVVLFLGLVFISWARNQDRPRAQREYSGGYSAEISENNPYNGRIGIVRERREREDRPRRPERQRESRPHRNPNRDPEVSENDVHELRPARPEQTDMLNREEPTREEPTREEPREEPTREEPTREEPTREEPTREETNEVQPKEVQTITEIVVKPTLVKPEEEPEVTQPKVIKSNKKPKVITGHDEQTVVEVITDKKSQPVKVESETEIEAPVKIIPFNVFNQPLRGHKPTYLSQYKPEEAVLIHQGAITADKESTQEVLVKTGSSDSNVTEIEFLDSNENDSKAPWILAIAIGVPVGIVIFILILVLIAFTADNRRRRHLLEQSTLSAHDTSGLMENEVVPENKNTIFHTSSSTSSDDEDSHVQEKAVEFVL